MCWKKNKSQEKPVVDTKQKQQPEVKTTKKIVLENHDISELFAQVVADIKLTMTQTGHKNPVDIELQFNRIQVSKKKILLSKRDTRTVTVKIATRITND